MTYVSAHDLWGAGSGIVATLPPSPGDLFCVTTAQGRQVFLDPVTSYDAAMRRANAFARRVVHPEPLVIKVVCLSMAEALVLGLAPADLFADQTPEQEVEMRQAVVTACHDALRNCPDAKVRSDALQLLTDLGAIR